MNLSAASYKDRPAVKLSTGRLEALFLPKDGGKMASLKCRETGLEFLCQTPGSAYQRLGAEGRYIDSECDGFDDMFPTIDPYAPERGAYAGIHYPDHGEICRLEHQVRMIAEGVEFTVRSGILPVTWSKRISQTPLGGLALHYKIENDGREDIPCLWAAHCMLRGDAGARVLTGRNPGDEIEIVFSSDPERFAPKSRRAWSGEPCLDRLDPFGSEGAAFKYYYTGASANGCCGCDYPGVGRLMFTSSGGAIPHLGVWLNGGSFQGKYNIALEPCTAPFDTPGEASGRGYPSSLPAGGALDFQLIINLMKP